MLSNTVSTSTFVIILFHRVFRTLSSSDLGHHSRAIVDRWIYYAHIHSSAHCRHVARSLLADSGASKRLTQIQGGIGFWSPQSGGPAVFVVLVTSVTRNPAANPSVSILILGVLLQLKYLTTKATIEAT